MEGAAIAVAIQGRLTRPDRNAGEHAVLGEPGPLALLNGETESQAVGPRTSAVVSRRPVTAGALRYSSDFGPPKTACNLAGTPGRYGERDGDRTRRYSTTCRACWSGGKTG